MSTFPIGIRSPLLHPNVTNAGDLKPGEVVATTPLGRDENGKNLVAYIVRTDEEVPVYKLPQNLANGNTPKKSFLSDNTALQAQLAETQLKSKSDRKGSDPNQVNKPETTSAQFIKPDDLLSRLEQSQLDQLRARDTAVRGEPTVLDDGAGQALLTSLIYHTGPDGRRYAVGVSAPLLTQQESEVAEADEEDDTSSPSGIAAQAYKQSSYYNSTDFRSGLLNKAI